MERCLNCTKICPLANKGGDVKVGKEDSTRTLKIGDVLISIAIRKNHPDRDRIVEDGIQPPENAQVCSSIKELYEKTLSSDSCYIVVESLKCPLEPSVTESVLVRKL